MKIEKSYRALKMKENGPSVNQILRRLQAFAEKVIKAKVVALKI